MRDAEKTVGNMIDKLKTAFIGSIDSEGFPNMKAMLQPRKREGIKTIYLTTNTSSMRVWGIERSGFFNGREKWAKGFENQRV